jgi:hypothetical protein
MQPHRRTSLVAIGVGSILVLTCLTKGVAARIEVDSDVSISWTQLNNVPYPAAVVGAPRLVRDWSSVRIDLDLAAGSTLHKDSELRLSFYSLDLCAVTQCPPPVVVSFEQDLTAFPSGGFRLAEDFHINLDKLPTPGILTIAGVVHGSGLVLARTITVSGDGDPIFIDRVGDDDHLHPGDVADVPTRSIELMRALNRIESSLLPKQLVELDAVRSPRAEVAVGWTHTFLPGFGVPDSERLKTAILTFRLLGGNPCSSNDVILLDRAVHDAATRQRPRLPLIFLRDLQTQAPNNGCPTAQSSNGEYHFHIDLTRVPIRFLSPGDPFPSPPVIVDLTEDLDDGQLNVIVAGRSSVDFSDLTITFDDSQ